MITNIIIFGLNVPNWIFWVIGGAVFLVLVVCAFLSGSEQIETKEAVRKEKEEKEKEREKKEQENGYHSLNNSDSDTTFFSVLNYKISVLWEVHRKSTNDILTLSSSLPIAMTENDLQNFQIILPGVINIKVINEWQLSFKKSPATDFYSIKEMIMKHLFCHLNKKYAWLGKNTTISLEVDKEEGYEHRMLCELEYNLTEHLTIAIRLGNINDIVNGKDLKDQVYQHNNYIVIMKNDDKTWDELIPLIKSVFTDYFPKDVEFTGDYPSIEKKSPSTKKEDEEINESNWTDAG